MTSPRQGRPGSIRGEAQARGVSEYRVRLERAEAAGLSPRAGVGHAKSAEASATDVRTVRRHPERASVEMLRRVAVVSARRHFRTEPKFDPKRFAKSVAAINDRETLKTMATASKEEWEDLARNQVPGNPFFYH